MSASEKLRAMEGMAKHAMHVDEFAEAVEPLYNPLPLIVAVIEAAEHAYEGYADDPMLFYLRQKTLAESLSALEKALP